MAHLTPSVSVGSHKGSMPKPQRVTIEVRGVLKMAGTIPNILSVCPSSLFYLRTEVLRFTRLQIVSSVYRKTFLFLGVDVCVVLVAI